MQHATLRFTLAGLGLAGLVALVPARATAWVPDPCAYASPNATLTLLPYDIVNFGPDWEVNSPGACAAHTQYVSIYKKTLGGQFALLKAQTSQGQWVSLPYSFVPSCHFDPDVWEVKYSGTYRVAIAVKVTGWFTVWQPVYVSAEYREYPD
jgi:hypothetical protein